MTTDGPPTRDAKEKHPIARNSLVRQEPATNGLVEGRGLAGEHVLSQLSTCRESNGGETRQQHVVRGEPFGATRDAGAAGACK